MQWSDGTGRKDAAGGRDEVRTMSRRDSRWEFFRPFHETQRGQIIGLATPVDPMRDGLAVALLARHFPVDGYDGIAVEPSRRALHPAENVILVGSSELFVNADAHPWSGTMPPLVVGEDKLRARLRNIKSGCCFAFANGDGRWLTNAVTGERWGPVGVLGSPYREDYGVIRRVFRAPFENTVIVEGIHRLGTLGAAKVVTSSMALDAVWDAVDHLPAFDESRPLEILVKAAFHDHARQQVYSVDTVQATPLALVYDRQWVFDLVNAREWVDQLPWPVHLKVRGDEAAVVARGAVRERPRLEIEADLRQAAPGFRQLVRTLFLSGVPAPPLGAPDADLDALLTALAPELDRFRVCLVDEGPFASSAERRQELPRGHSRIRKLRKQFLVHLALRRVRNRRLRCDEASIRRYFPDFEPGECAKPFASQFIGAVPGRMREGFDALFGEAKHPRDLVRIEYARRQMDYALHLERAVLVVRLRV